MIAPKLEPQGKPPSDATVSATPTPSTAAGSSVRRASSAVGMLARCGNPPRYANGGMVVA